MHAFNYTRLPPPHHGFFHSFEMLFRCMRYGMKSWECKIPFGNYISRKDGNFMVNAKETGDKGGKLCGFFCFSSPRSFHRSILIKFLKRRRRRLNAWAENGRHRRRDFLSSSQGFGLVGRKWNKNEFAGQTTKLRFNNCISSRWLQGDETR